MHRQEQNKTRMATSATTCTAAPRIWHFRAFHPKSISLNTVVNFIHQLVVRVEYNFIATIQSLDTKIKRDIVYFYTDTKGIFTSGEEQTDVKPKPKLPSPNPQVVVLLLIAAIKKDDNQD